MLAEITFFGLGAGALFIGIKIKNAYKEDLERKKFLKDAFKDPQELINKLNNPEFEYQGKRIKFKELIEDSKKLTYYLDTKGNVAVKTEDKKNRVKNFDNKRVVNPNAQ